jgi:hypothetical protein
MNCQGAPTKNPHSMPIHTSFCMAMSFHLPPSSQGASKRGIVVITNCNMRGSIEKLHVPFRPRVAHTHQFFLGFLQDKANKIEEHVKFV